jgi:hypothetical protein
VPPIPPARTSSSRATLRFTGQVLLGSAGLGAAAGADHDVVELGSRSQTARSTLSCGPVSHSDRRRFVTASINKGLAPSAVGQITCGRAVPSPTPCSRTQRRGILSVTSPPPSSRMSLRADPTGADAA